MTRRESVSFHTMKESQKFIIIKHKDNQILIFRRHEDKWISLREDFGVIQVDQTRIRLKGQIDHSCHI